MGMICTVRSTGEVSTVRSTLWVRPADLYKQGFRLFKGSWTTYLSGERDLLRCREPELLEDELDEEDDDEDRERER